MNIDRRTFLTGVAALTAFRSTTARAANGLPFDAEAFCAAQEAGKTIVLEITAKWCGPCQKQRPVVAKLLEAPEFAKLIMFDADYDANKNDLVKINALQLTTLIIYHGKTEAFRSSGETKPEMIEAFLKKAL